MMKNNWIIIKEYCEQSRIEPSFIDLLEDDGLITLEHEGEDEYLPLTELDDLERLARLHYDLSINIEGLSAVNHLLNQVRDLQKEVKSLENELHFYKTF